MRKISQTILSLIAYCRRRPIVPALILIVLVLAISYILRLLAPGSQVQSISKPEIVTTKIAADFSSVPISQPQTFPNVPATLPVYQASASKFPVSAFLAEFNLERTEYDNRYENPKTHQRLTYDPQTTIFQYWDESFEGDADPAIGVKIDREKALIAANEFVQKRLQLNRFTAVPANMTFYNKSDEEEAEPVPVEEANIAEIPFTELVNGEPSFVGTTKYLPLTVFVDSTNKVINFRLYENTFSLGKSSVASTISVSDVTKAFKAGEVDIVRMYASDADQFKLKNLKDLSLQSVALQYRFVSSSSLVVPYFFITGTVSYTTDLEPMKVDFLLPAVHTSAN